jgi:hypothetical protein
MEPQQRLNGGLTEWDDSQDAGTSRGTSELRLHVAELLKHDTPPLNWAAPTKKATIERKADQELTKENQQGRISNKRQRIIDYKDRIQE